MAKKKTELKSTRQNAVNLNAEEVALQNLTLKVGASGEIGAVGGLNMNSNVLPNLADGVAATDGTNKLQVESLIAASAIPVIDNLTSTSLTSALSANQGRVLNAAQTGTVKSINNIIDATSSEMTSLLPGTANSSATNVGQVDAKIAAAIPPFSSPTPSIIQAEISDALNPTDESGFQWSFGSGAKSPIGSGILITEPVDIVSMFISADPAASTGTGTVRLYKNGAPVPSSLIGNFVDVTANTANNHQGIANIFPAISLTTNDIINFKTETVSGTVSNARVGITCIGSGSNLGNSAFSSNPVPLNTALAYNFNENQLIAINESQLIAINEVLPTPSLSPVNSSKLKSNSSGHKLANGIFKAKLYSERPPFYTRDIPDYFYHADNPQHPDKFTLLVNTKFEDTELLSLINETEILEISFLVNNSGIILFNLANKKHCVVIDNVIKYLQYEG